MKNFTVHSAPQGTPEWLAARLGRVTASRMKDVLATIKSGEAAARRDYRTQLVCERLTGQPQDDVFVSADMQREEVSLAVPQMAHDIEKFLVEVDNEESALRGWGVLKETA